MRSRRYGTGSFQTEFDVPAEPGLREKIKNMPATERLAETMAQRWWLRDERTYTQNVNQEPCYEELQAQHVKGVPSAELRKAALARRRELNGGFTPCSPDSVKKAVLEACAIVDAYRKRFPKIDLSSLFKAPA